MVFKTDGIVLKQRSIGDSDRILTILTREHGLLEASVRGYKSIKNSALNSVGLLGYYRFDIFDNNYRYKINSAEALEDFFDIRLDVEKLALAGYFCELMCSLAPPKVNAWAYLRLLLNTLSFLNSGKRTMPFLKAVFELRVMAQSGYMPDLVCCHVCCAYEKEQMYFFPLRGDLICGDCLKQEQKKKKHFPLSKPVLLAMRHIIYSELDKLFAFSLTGNSLNQLNTITEYYILMHFDKFFCSLKMYYDLKPDL